MKVRTEAKRDAILEVAQAAFLELGFERTSMADIAARVGGSKATLYGYFPSKEALFLAVTQNTGERHMFEAIQQLADSPADDLGAALRRFAEQALIFMTMPTTVATHRMVIGEAGHSDIGRLFYEAGPQRGTAVVAEVMRAAMARGALRQGDPEVAARHFFALTTSETQHHWMCRDVPMPSRAQIKQMVQRAVDAFLRGHGA